MLSLHHQEIWSCCCSTHLPKGNSKIITRGEKLLTYFDAQHLLTEFQKVKYWISPDLEAVVSLYSCLPVNREALVTSTAAKPPKPGTPAPCECAGECNLHGLQGSHSRSVCHVCLSSLPSAVFICILSLKSNAPNGWQLPPGTEKGCWPLAAGPATLLVLDLLTGLWEIAVPCEPLSALIKGKTKDYPITNAQ